MTFRRFIVAASLLLGAACRPDASIAPDDATASLFSSSMCQEPNPLYCGPANGTIHDGTGLGVAPSVPGDPYPGAPGIWLGNMLSARFCYAKSNLFITDADTDWLDDTCEYELAKAFAPTLFISPGEHCGGGEPYWAAKLFINVDPYHWGDFVRLAYMPAYYTDCGAPSHGGDSEFIMIAVQWNPATRHWEVRNAFLSSHEGAATDQWPLQWHSDWHDRDELFYSSASPLYGFPQVWIARDKHANYRSRAHCEEGAVTFDTCPDNQAMGRMRVYRDRNVGSPRLDRFPGLAQGGVPPLGGAYSTNPHNAPLNEVSEFFYAERKFRGWQHGIEGVTPYSNFLYSVNFERFMYAANQFWWGIPQPAHPSVATMTGDVDGPSSVTLWTTVTWTTFVTGGTPPYRAVWYRQNAGQDPYNPVHWWQVGMSTQPSGTPFTAGSFTQYQSNCEAFRIKAIIYDVNNQQVWDTWYRAVSLASCPPPPYMVTSITRDGNYYTANVYGGAPPYTFTWEWMGYDCGGEVPVMAGVSALEAGDLDLARRRPRTRRPPPGPGDAFPRAVACGWNYFSSQQVVYWNQPNRTLRVTYQDSNYATKVETYFVPFE